MKSRAHVGPPRGLWHAGVLWVVTVAALGVATLAAQTPAVDTASGRELSRWLAVFNGLDREARQAFYRERWAYRPNQAFYEDLREQTGGFEVLRVEESTAARTVAIAKQVDSDAVSRITFEIEPAEPYRIVRFAAPTVPRPADLPIARVSEAELVTMLRASLDRWAAADRFAGAVLVARNGRPIFTVAYGLADRERAVANTVETRFKNGSMNKMFTAAATLLLVREGRLALEDTLGKHLTDYPNKAVASAVTIHQLLTHTGALTDHRLLDAKYTAMLTTGKVATPGGKYAYGFVETANGGVRTFGHSGGAPGQNGDLIVLPESGYVVAVLSNMDPPAATRVSNYIAARLPVK